MKATHAFALVIALAAGNANSGAVVTVRTQLQTPVNNCQGALPAYEGKIRKRPLAMSNEGDSTAFITCALSSNDDDYGNSEVGAMLTNTTAAAVTVTCTLVDNPVYWLWNPGAYPAPSFHPQAIVVAANTSRLMHWNAEQMERAAWSDNVNMSCALPPGTEMAYNYRNYNQPAP